MKKKRILLLLILIILVLVSCKLEKTSKNSFVLRGGGAYIANYPDWTHYGLFFNKGVKFTDIFLLLYSDYLFDNCIGYSDWKDWQSEEGKRLHSYVSGDVISDYYEGKYRVIVFGQDIMLGFNDKEGTVVNILFNWIQLYTGGGLCLSQSDISNKYEYSCHAINKLTEEKGDYNKSYVTITKTGDNKFRYEQVINGELVICEDMNVLAWQKNEVSKPDWYPKRIEGIRGFDSFLFPLPEDFDDIRIIPGCLYLNMMEYDYPTYTTGNVLSLEGFKLREQDDENMTISFDFLDADKGGLADYVEIRRKDDDFVNITFYKDGKIVRQHKNLSCYDY